MKLSSQFSIKWRRALTLSEEILSKTLFSRWSSGGLRAEESHYQDLGVVGDFGGDVVLVPLYLAVRVFQRRGLKWWLSCVVYCD